MNLDLRKSFQWTLIETGKFDTLWILLQLPDFFWL